MMNDRLMECVPNISEGKNPKIINEIVAVVKSVHNIKLLDVDSGQAANRTVITFAGIPEAVVEAAFLLIKKSAELIDMSKHKGEHPRFGATDVCPLIPIRGVTMEETIKFARNLGARVGNELRIPVYLYENASTQEKRKNLANCRAGEYENLKEKITSTEWKPDYGSLTYSEVVKKSGAVAIGARNYLIAYNVNLSTTSVEIANEIAKDVRESGRKIKDKSGNSIHIPGLLPNVKAIGWYIDDFKLAQVSMNLTNVSITPLHVAFNEIIKAAQKRGVHVTGSELVGLIPLICLTETADYILKQQSKSTEINESEKVKIAIHYLGLSSVKPFVPEDKIIEYKLKS